MSVFNIQMPDVYTDQDLKKVTAYLYKLNEQLTYMFNNLNPEDNYSKEAYVKYIQQGEQVAQLEVSLGKVSAEVRQNAENLSKLTITVNEISIQMVRKGQVVSAINMSEEEIKIIASKISLEGIVTANENFKVLLEGSIRSKNGEFSGTITASHISGATIEGSVIGDSNGNFYTDGDTVYFGGFQAYDTFYGRYIATIGSERNGIGDNRKYAVWSGWDGNEAAFYATEDGEISCTEIYSSVAGESWSDQRLKDNIRELDSRLMAEIVRNLRPVSFTMKKYGKEGIGFIAQDVYLLCRKLGVDLPMYGYTPDRKYFTIPYQNYIAISIAAKKHMMDEMEALRKRIEEVERMVKNG